MRLKFERKRQKEFLKKVKELKNCTWNELAIFLQIELEALKNWYKERILLPKNIFKKIIKYYPQLASYENFVIEEKSDNWGQVVGEIRGSETIIKKLKTDTLFRTEWIKNSKKGGNNNIKKGLIKNWDVGFRKIGIRKIIGPKNEKMFTEMEKRIAEFFIKNKIDYEYEPLLKIGGKNYFPDFQINKAFIIERCGVVSKNYFKSLQNKLNDYEKIKRNVVLIFPKKARNSFIRNIKIPKRFVYLVEDENFTELGDYLIEFIGA